MAGRLTLTQNNSYTGTTYVQTGILDIQKSNSLGLNNGNAIQRVTVVDPALADTFQLTKRPARPPQRFLSARPPPPSLPPWNARGGLWAPRRLRSP